MKMAIDNRLEKALAFYTKELETDTLPSVRTSTPAIRNVFHTHSNAL